VRKTSLALVTFFLSGAAAQADTAPLMNPSPGTNTTTVLAAPTAVAPTSVLDTNVSGISAPSPVAADAKDALAAQLTALEAQQAEFESELAAEQKFYDKAKADFEALVPYVSGATDYATALKRERLLAGVPLTPDEKNLCDGVTYKSTISDDLGELPKRIAIYQTAVTSMKQFLPLARQSLTAGDFDNVSHIIESLAPSVASAQEMVDKPGALGGTVGYFLNVFKAGMAYYLKVTTTQ
jgi:hypothetical protein